MNEVLIRTVNEEDVQSCYQIELLCFKPAEAATWKEIKIRQQQYTDCFWVAELNGQVIGFINGGATKKLIWLMKNFKIRSDTIREGKTLLFFCRSKT